MNIPSDLELRLGEIRLWLFARSIYIKYGSYNKLEHWYRFCKFSLDLNSILVNRAMHAVITQDQRVCPSKVELIIAYKEYGLPVRKTVNLCSCSLSTYYKYAKSNDIIDGIKPKLPIDVSVALHDMLKKHDTFIGMSKQGVDFNEI